MHCSDEELISNNDSKTKSHLQICQECQQRFWQLKQLRVNAEQLPLFKPSNTTWLRVKETLPKQPQKKRLIIPISIAASFIGGILVTLISNNVWQKYKIEEQVAISTSYDKRFVLMEITTQGMEHDLWKISQIDKVLNQEGSTIKQKKLWQERNQILKHLLEQKNVRKEVI